MEAHGFISNTLNCCRYDVVSNVTTKVKDKKLTMRILIVNTSERTGGAAVAANRLMEALKNNGVKAKMLVVNKTSDQLTVVGLSHQWLQRWRFLWERFTVFCHLHFSKNNLFAIDIANTGADITSLPEFREADLIHLSWINQGMLSLSDIKKIVKSGKPVVWTMHDLWPATAICHYACQCAMFKTGCHNCRLLPGGGSANDLSSKVWRKKKALYHNSNIQFVTCSRWLEAQAKQSGLFIGQRVCNIPNPIDSRIYAPADRREARLNMGLPAEGRVILFVAQRVDDERKGVAFFIEAINRLAASSPQFAETTSVAVIGKNSEQIADEIKIRTFALGTISGSHAMAAAYNAADVFVLPSLEDNLPNTIMESMACGVPCVGFRVGGIPEMIDHRRNGYIANFKDTADLAAGISWVLTEADHDSLSHEARNKVLHCYSQQNVAAQYVEVYNEMIAQKTYRI